jgi:hypothetical protein
MAQLTYAFPVPSLRVRSRVFVVGMAGVMSK